MKMTTPRSSSTDSTSPLPRPDHGEDRRPSQILSPRQLPVRLAPRPELLAPAGDHDCLRAAIENGADAVYFGLNCGFNARARATNFGPAELPQIMAQLHHRGVKGFV